jgi:poly(3-hydroxybutyrate) depolymerase
LRRPASRRGSCRVTADRRRHLLQEGVGHYSVFSGSRLEREIHPQVRAFIADAERAA